MLARTGSNEKGFSLIELMIVVAIIGILATIAIPNFTRFQVKARQSEAKSNLSAIYTAEKAFQVEWNQFYGDFRDIGYAPEGQLHYQLGFQAAGPLPPAPFAGSTNGAGAGTCVNTGVSAVCRNNATIAVGVPAAWAQAPANGAACPAGANPTLNTFRVSAYTLGAAIGGTAASPDAWSINELRSLCSNASSI